MQTTSAKRKPIPGAAWKIYGPSGGFTASCLGFEEAVLLVSFQGDGSQVRNGHAKKSVIWHEGHEVQSAAESYDYAASVMAERMTPACSRVHS